MDVKALQVQLAAFAAERNWEPVHSPKNLAMAVASEAGALLELFKWLSDDQSRRVGGTDAKEVAADIVAAIVLHILRFADKVGIDLEQAVMQKLVRQAEKHPVPDRIDIATAPAPVVARPAEQANLREQKPPERTRSTSSAGAPPRRPARPPAAKQSVAPPARVESVSAPPPPRAESASAPPPLERYTNLDTDAAKRLFDSLSRRVDGAASDNPLLRELHDELETLKRALYAAAGKPVWIADSLKTIRRMLEEAATLSLAEQVQAQDHIDDIDRILAS